MIYIDNKITNPFFNLASEEYLLKNTDKEYFMLWRNEQCIVVGKNQNTLSEINLDFVNKNKIPVIRRLTGGGAVFHDLGNLNFTFIVNDVKNLNHFKKFVMPIIEVLNGLGVQAELTGRNDLTVQGKKISGNAQTKYKSRLLHHGTLLFSADMSKLSKALNPKPVKFQDKSIKSIVSRVTNVCDYLTSPISVAEFKNLISDYMKKNDTESRVIEFTKEDIKRIQALADEKYLTWEWNFGVSPKYNFRNSGKFPGGTVEVYLQVNNGIIGKANIYGDFFGEKEICNLENAIIGVRHIKSEIMKALCKFDIDDYMFNIKTEDLIELFM